MGLRRLYKRIFRTHKQRPRRKPKTLRKARQKHQADAPPKDGSCLLLALPAELRVRILEYALCQRTPIQAREDITPKKHYSSYGESLTEYDEWPQGKPDLSILRVCRQLYNEGSPIFYNKNTFGITVYDPGYGQSSEVDVLGLGDVPSAFQRMPRLQDCANFSITFVLANNVRGESLASYKWAIDGPIEQFQQRWKRRGRLNVEVIQKDREWARDSQGGAALFHKLGLIRCKDVRFRGFPYSISHRLTQLIESDRPVYDLQNAFGELKEYLEGTSLRDYSVETMNDDIWLATEKAAVEYDEATFLTLRRQVIEASNARMLSALNTLMDEGNELKDKTLPVRTVGNEVDHDLEATLMQWHLS